MTEIYTFKTIVKQLINTNKMKVWLSQKRGKRAEFLFKIGTEQFVPPIKIFENDDYILFGQNINDQLKNELLKEVENYAENA